MCGVTEDMEEGNKSRRSEVHSSGRGGGGREEKVESLSISIIEVTYLLTSYMIVFTHR